MKLIICNFSQLAMNDFLREEERQRSRIKRRRQEIDPSIRDLLRVNYVHEGHPEKFFKKSGKKNRRKDRNRITKQKEAKDGRNSREESHGLTRRVLEVLPEWETVEGILDSLIGIHVVGERYQHTHHKVLVRLLTQERKRQMRKNTNSLEKRKMAKDV